MLLPFPHFLERFIAHVGNIADIKCFEDRIDTDSIVVFEHIGEIDWQAIDQDEINFFTGNMQGCDGMLDRSRPGKRMDKLDFAYFLGEVIIKLFIKTKSSFMHGSALLRAY